jgi:hypothetical protein
VEVYQPLSGSIKLIVANGKDMGMGRATVSSVEKRMRKDVESFAANNRVDRVANYAARGRCHRNLSEPALDEVWVAAFREMAIHPADPDRRHAVNDFDAEFELRGRLPPLLRVREYQDQYARAIFGAFAKMTDEEQAAVNRDIQRDIDDFKSRRDRSKN